VPSKGPGSPIDPPLFPERLAMIFQRNQGYAILNLCQLKYMALSLISPQNNDKTEV
jgi:hypothetical protein